MKNDETKKDRVGSLFRINSMRNTHMAKGECLLVCYAYMICAILRSEKATLLVLLYLLRYDVRWQDSNLNEFEFFTEYSS